MSVKTYIDLDNSGTYVEVFPNQVGVFTKKLFSGEKFLRYDWGEVTIKNDPRMYALTGSDIYRLYNLIKAKKYNEDIKIKHVYTDYLERQISIEGIFNSYLCSYQDDDEHKVLKVTPVVFDQYTYFLDNWENAVDVVTGGNKNKIVNGDFSSWENNTTPIGWSTDLSYLFTLGVQLYRKFDKTYARISKLVGSSNVGYMSQSIPVNKDNSIQFSFDYEVIHYEENSVNKIPAIRKYCITFSAVSGGLYYLQNDKSWSLTPNEITYTSNGRGAIQIAYFEKMLKYSIVTGVLPEDGVVTVYFYSSDYNSADYHITFLVLGNIKLYTNSAIFETITIDLKTSIGLSSKALYNSSNPLLGRPTVEDYNDGQPLWADSPLFGYFNENASPNWERIDDVGLALRDAKLNDATLTNIKQSILTDPNDSHDFYLGELSQIKVYEVDKNEHISLGMLEWVRYLIVKEYQRILATCEFTREITYTHDVDGTPVVPTGEGWWDSSINNEPGNGRKWIRTPFGGAYSEEWEFFDNSEQGGAGMSPKGQIGELNGWKYHAVVSSRIKYPSNNTYTYRGISFRDILRILFRSTHPIYSTKEVYSNFFWNSNESDLPLLENNPGTNYVTRDVNFLNNITCLHTAVLKTSISDDSADTELKMSFKDAWDDIKSYFNIHELNGLYFWIDDNYDLHIEHEKYMEMLATSVNISGSVLKPMSDWKTNSEVLYSLITFDQVNSGGINFHLNKMRFDDMTLKVSPKKTLDNKSKILSTDVKFCLENPNNLSNGLILINHDGDGNALYAETGEYIGGRRNAYKNSELNGNLSLDTILNLFCRYTGIWIDGYINEREVHFQNILRIKNGEEISIKGIVSWPFFDTPIGYGGMVLSITHDFAQENTKALLSYRTNFALMAQKTDDFVGAENIMLNLGFNLS